MLDLQSVPLPSEDHCVREIGDETVFLSESGSEVLSLNNVGSFIWKQVDGKNRLRDILDIICREYEVDAERAEADLRAFVVRLAELDLLTLQSPDQ